MKRFTPVYAIAYGIMNGMENLRFEFPRFSLDFYSGYFIKEIENILFHGVSNGVSKCWVMNWNFVKLR